MFKWVHISDLHFYNSKRDDVKKMKTELPKELSKLEDIDALFITGDFRFAKEYNSSDKEEIIKYIKKLAKTLKIDTQKVFCVPGNHDLDRGKVRQAVIQSLRDVNGYSPQEGYLDKEVLDNLKKDFSFFKDIEIELHGKSDFFDGDDIHVVKDLGKCNLIMLNTALTAGNDEDRGYLYLGSSYIEKAISQIDLKKPTIMIGHHGCSFLNRDENKYIQNKFKEANINLYLCGHEHALMDENVWDGVRQYTAGCIWNDEDEMTKAGYYVGTLSDENHLEIEAFHWITESSKWWTHPVNCSSIDLSAQCPKKDLTDRTEYDMENEDIVHLSEVISTYSNIPMKKYEFTLNGHTLLGGLGKDGIKYYWIKNGNRVESIAFNTRTCYPHHDLKTRAEDAEISSYTTSVSFGCVLSASGQQCRFCETGSSDFKALLTSEEIALQNIFMALYDADCPSFPEVRKHEREFAFMGQGEPGYNYPAVRRAIQLTDIAMEAINQKIHRYIISTCGIADFVPLLISDIKTGAFKNKVTLHYSLHAIDDTRKIIMPIDNQYNYKEFIELCKELYEVSNEKIGVGIMMFQSFVPVKKHNDSEISPITLDVKTLKNILSKLDPNIFRIDLCDFNAAPTVTAERGEFKNETARKLLKVALDQGFEAKTFSSFGIDKKAGCGMLKSEYYDATEDGEKTLDYLEKAYELLHYSIQKLKEENNN